MPGWGFDSFHASNITKKVKSMNNTITGTESLTIADSLRTMEVGEQMEFSPLKTQYLRNLVSQRMVEERLAGMRWRVEFLLDDGKTVVTRTA